MIKVIKKVVISSVSILGISFLVWTLFLLNPAWSYANKTQFEFIEVYHNKDLEEQTEEVIKQAITIIKHSDLFNEDVSIQLCLNDDVLYPHLNPLAGAPLAYATLNKTVIKNCTPKFRENIAEAQWAVNNNELRKFKLTWLLAHEFTHNLQFQANLKYVLQTTLGKINWKLEGHAEYISREFKKDGALKNKIEQYLIEQQKEHKGLAVFELEDGTKQILSYYKYALVIQYLIEEKTMNFHQICELEVPLEEVYSEMLEWSKKQ